MNGFFDALLEFLGLKQPKAKPEKSGAGRPAAVDFFSRISQPKAGGLKAFEKKSFAVKRKPQILQKGKKQALAKKPSAVSLQFEIEQILKEARALKRKLKQKGVKVKKLQKWKKSKKEKKKLQKQKKVQKQAGRKKTWRVEKKEAKGKRKTQGREKKEAKGKRKIQWGEKREAKALVKKRMFEFKPLTKIEVSKFRQKLDNEKSLSDLEIDRLKTHLENTGKESPAAFARTILQVPESASIIISSQQQAQTQELETPAVLSLEEQVESTEKLLKNLETDFLKRRISEQEYRQRFAELTQKLHGLKNKQRESIEKKPEERTQSMPATGFSGVKQPESMQKTKQVFQAFKQQARQAGKAENQFQKPTRANFEQKASQKFTPTRQAKAKFSFTPSSSAVSSKPTAVAGVSEGLENFLRERLGKSDNARLEELEDKVHELMLSYNLSEKQVELEISKLDKNTLISNFDKLVDLIELERKTQQLMLEKLEKEKSREAEEKLEYDAGFNRGIPEAKKQEVKEIIAEVAKHRIVTDFDRLLELVQKKGAVSADSALKELGISKPRLNECVNVLEENNLVKVNFPPMGSVMIYDLNFVPQKKQARKKGA